MSQAAQLPQPLPGLWQEAGVVIGVYVRMPDDSEPVYLSMGSANHPITAADVDGAVGFLKVIRSHLVSAS